MSKKGGTTKFFVDKVREITGKSNAEIVEEAMMLYWVLRPFEYATPDFHLKKPTKRATDEEKEIINFYKNLFPKAKGIHFPAVRKCLERLHREGVDNKKIMEVISACTAYPYTRRIINNEGLVPLPALLSENMFPNLLSFQENQEHVPEVSNKDYELHLKSQLQKFVNHPNSVIQKKARKALRESDEIGREGMHEALVVIEKMAGIRKENGHNE